MKHDLLDAAYSNSIEAVISALADDHDSINRRETYGKTALHHAAWNGNVNIARLLLEHGAGIDFTDNRGFTPLHEAVLNKNFDVVRFLCENGADIGHRASDGKNALDIAHAVGHIGIIKWIETFSLNPVKPGSKNNRTEIVKSYDNVISILLESGADVTYKNSDGKTALDYARESGKDDLVKLIEDHLKKKDEELESGLNAMFKHGGNVDNDMTALHLAVANNKRDIVKFLLENGANPDAISIDGYTPLMDGVQANALESVKILLEHGANTSRKNNNGETALDISKKWNLKEISDLIIAHEEQTLLNDSLSDAHNHDIKM